MTDAERKRLRELADAATQPSPWSTKSARHQGSSIDVILDANGLWVADCGQAPADAAFIAAANPQTVLALLDEVEELRMTLTILEHSDAEDHERVAEQLAAMTRARDEACEIAASASVLRQSLAAEDEARERITELRKVGQP